MFDSPCDEEYNLNVTVLWFTLVTVVTSNNKTDFYDISEVLLKVALKSNNDNSIFFSPI
jgi:hypothetical protein